MGYIDYNSTCSDLLRSDAYLIPLFIFIPEIVVLLITNYFFSDY